MLGEYLMRLMAVVLAGSLGVAARDVTDDEYARFPKLYHLDDFETCLMETDGLYCLGSFLVKPLNDPDPTYELMKEYSTDSHNFNRTLLHRGYCVSSRCASLTDRNPSRRFERCASLYAQRSGLRALLIELNYCRSHAQDVALKDMDNSVGTPHRVFLYVLEAILALNLIGTVYDVTTKKERKNKLLTSWSLVSNWPRLAGPYPDGDPRLVSRLPFEAFRAILIQLMVVTHTGCLHNILYLQNSKYVERMSHHPAMMLLQNGSSAIQMFIALSNFLLAESLLSMQQPPKFGLLPNIILKRIFRIAPVYVLVMSYAATWWPLVRDGPMWPMLVGQESEVCRRKFWPNVFFLQNFVEPEQSCQWQTWFIAVDMQLHIVGCVITLCVARVRRLALPLLGAGFIVSVALNSYRAYVNDWKPLMFVTMPEHIRVKFRTAPSFSQFYISPTGSLPSCLVGLFMAHLLHYLREIGFKPADHKGLITWCQAAVLLVPAWIYTGLLLDEHSSRQFMALYIALERNVITLIGAAMLFGSQNGIVKQKNKNPAPTVTMTNGCNHDKDKILKAPTKGFLERVFCWRVWFPLSRMSLSVLMLHWCVNCMILGSRLTPITSTTLDIAADWMSTAFVTYLLAVPITLMVEIPFQQIYSAITSQR